MARPSGRRTAQFSLPQGQPQPTVPSLENNFTGGLKTEYTGLNFPENACTATTNCRFTRTGNVLRRNGFNYETNALPNGLTADRTNKAISTYQWTNAGGTGNQAIMVTQVGGTLHFWQISKATASLPLSWWRTSIIPLANFQAGSTSPDASECQYSTGNGYLFVFHPNCDPFYCTFANSIVSANRITVQIRDFIGINENTPANNRPLGLSAEHSYNLLNQGWFGSVTAGSAHSATGTANSPSSPNLYNPPNPPSPGTYTFTTQAGLTIVNGDTATVYGVAGNLIGTGTVTSYAGTTLSINLTTTYLIDPGLFGSSFKIQTSGTGGGSTGLIGTWFAAVGNYPSNSDIWWTFKDTTNTFNPAVTINQVTLNAGPAPKGYFILSAFDQQRSSISGIGGLTSVTTTTRPRTGAWFQGRVWYSGADASQAATGDASFYTWTENVYFSQIITNVSQFGMCYENNDPTSETLNALLPSDGGVIQIQGSGSIYKLFPVVNGLLVFAANGIWFITGSSGIGFSANDYTVSKVSGEHAISGTSFIDIAGWPIFWNGDGIYMVAPGQSYTSGQTALQVQNLTLPTIKQFYNAIPLSSKLFARGSYNHITGEVQWIYRSTTETDVTSRYSFDSALVYLTYTQAFYPWSIGTGANILSADYIEFTGATPAISPPAVFKYFTATPSGGTYNFTFSEEKNNTTYTDWPSLANPFKFTSSFQTGYRLKGQGQRKFQPTYMWIYTDQPTAGYTLQGVFDYAGSPLSGRISGVQVVNVNKPLYNKSIRRHRIRGNGYVLQFLISSLDGLPFNFAGWGVLDTIGIQ